MSQGYAYVIHRVRRVPPYGLFVSLCNGRDLAQLGSGKWAEVTCKKCLAKREALLAARQLQGVRS